jgi:hypothetical protein
LIVVDHAAAMQSHAVALRQEIGEDQLVQRVLQRIEATCRWKIRPVKDDLPVEKSARKRPILYGTAPNRGERNSNTSSSAACERRLLLVLHLNHQTRLRPIKRSGRERPQHGAQNNEQEDTHRDVPIPVDDAQTIEEVRGVGRSRKPHARIAASGLRETGPDLLLRSFVRFTHLASRVKWAEPYITSRTGLCKGFREHFLTEDALARLH